MLRTGLLMMCTYLITGSGAFAQQRGGFDISGNAEGFRILQSQAADNCKYAAAMKRANGTRRGCESGGQGCNYQLENLKGIKITFGDGETTDVIPLSYKQPENCATPCNKRLLVFLRHIGRGMDGKNLEIATRELTVDDHFAHENVVDVNWKAKDGSTYALTKFTPISYWLSDAEKDAVVSMVQNCKDGPDLKDLACEVKPQSGYNASDRSGLGSGTARRN